MNSGVSVILTSTKLQGKFSSEPARPKGRAFSFLGEKEYCTATQNFCSRCAILGKTCCQETDIYLATDDIKRIAGYVSRIDFYEYRYQADHLYLEQEDDPVWSCQTIGNDGTRRVLKQNIGHDCLFLGADGCQLSMTVRPLVCRLHPYTYDVGGLTGILDSRCLMARQEDGRDVIAAMGMTLAQAQSWHLQLYNEICIHEGTENNEDWHNLRPAV